MAEQKSERRVIVAVLLTSTLLTMLGISGLIVGSSNLSNQPIPDLQEGAGEQAGDSLSPELLQVVIMEAVGSYPLRRPFAAANILVSALVLLGSFMLSWRRKLAFWWVRQAVTAKVLWIVANSIALVYHLRVGYPKMQLRDISEEIDGLLTWSAVWLVVAASFNILLHVGAAWRATRPDIKAFVEGATRA